MENKTTNGFWKITALSAALLLGVANIPACAAGVTVGSGGVGVGAGAAGDNGTATIGFSNGSLVAVDSNGNPVNDGSKSSAAVNLGTALGEVGIGDGTAATTGNIATAVASLSDSGQKNLKLRCVDVMASPTTHKSDIVALCRVVAKL
jgi:hypothetical protein